MVKDYSEERERERGRETILMCLHPIKVKTRLSRNQRPTKPVNRLVTGRGGGGGGRILKIALYYMKTLLIRLRTK